MPASSAFTASAELLIWQTRDATPILLSSPEVGTTISTAHAMTAAAKRPCLEHASPPGSALIVGAAQKPRDIGAHSTIAALFMRMKWRR